MENDEGKAILVVEDDSMALANLEHILTREGYRVTAVDSGERALVLLEEREFDLVLTDLKMRHVDGLRVLARAKEEQPLTEVVMITAYATVDTAVEAMRHGAYHYISKPYKIELLRKVVNEALYKRQMSLENLRLKERLRELEENRDDRPLMVGNSPPVRRVTRLLEQVAPADSNLLITGETGTGKELAARTIHHLSRRREHPFVAFNCGAFAEDLIANELFGHEKDAYTGARAQKTGLLETAHKGTVFLDEIGEMPLNMQVSLLRVIEEGEVLRVGGTTPVPVDVRFVAATARDLHHECDKGRFRNDLYYRLNVVTITMPPLAEREGDIPLLVSHFLARKGRKAGKSIRGVEPEAMEVLTSYSWPGNVRELENVMERAVVLAGGDTIRPHDLPADLTMLNVTTHRAGQARLQTLEEQEKDYIARVLDQTGWNKTKAAEILGIDRASLWRKLKRFGLQ
ncbi:MAG: sigma-54-dependent transcriptional regulator [Desulfatibacillaceae bacterium]